MKYKTIGVLGGMGPVTSANFYSEMIGYAQRKYKAENDNDFPQIIINSLPLQGFDETGVLDRQLVLNQLKKGNRMLENSGSDFIVMPCNTVHCFIDELREDANIPILSIIEETIKTVQEKEIEPVGILGSETTFQLKLYEKELKKKSISYITPGEEHFPAITGLILDVMGGSRSGNRDKVLDIIRGMSQSSEGLILGCTELHSAIKQSDTTMTVFDSLLILAEVAVDKSMSRGIQ